MFISESFPVVPPTILITAHNPSPEEAIQNIGQLPSTQINNSAR